MDVIDQPSRARSRCTVGEQVIGVVSVLSVSGTVDTLTAPQLAAAISTASAAAPPAVIVDLTEVDFLASAGMGVLVAAHAELSPALEFAVVADGPVTRRPLTLIGLTEIFGVFPDLDSALDAVTAR